MLANSSLEVKEKNWDREGKTGEQMTAIIRMAKRENKEKRRKIG